MTKVLVTGISGFIGSYLAERLCAEGYQVAGYIRQTNRLNYPTVQRLLGRVSMYYGSLTDFPSVRYAVNDFRPDVICHLGAVTPVAYSFDHAQEVTETNYLGTINLAEAALQHCANLKKFILASSMEVYGFLSKRAPFVETDDPSPACPYAVAKLAAEKYVRYLHYAHKFPGVVFRQTNCYGRKENDYFIIEAIVTQMLKDKDNIRLGDPEPFRNFIFIDDLIDLYVETIKSSANGLLGEVFNTGPANAVSIRELAEKIVKMLSWNGKINWYTRPKRPGEIYYLNSSNQKIAGILGWAPRVSLDEGLRRTIQIWDQNLVTNL